MTSLEVYTALFWIVAGGYLVYLGWTIYSIVSRRTARNRHPSSLPRTVSPEPGEVPAEIRRIVSHTTPGS